MLQTVMVHQQKQYEFYNHNLSSLYKYTVAFNPITICSYNRRNLKSSVAEIRSLCDNCDILLLQETWLHEQELSILAGIHPDFYARGISSMDHCGHIPWATIWRTGDIMEKVFRILVFHLTYE